MNIPTRDELAHVIQVAYWIRRQMPDGHMGIIPNPEGAADAVLELLREKGNDIVHG